MSAARRFAPALQVRIEPQPRLQGLIAIVAMASAAGLVATLVQHRPAWMVLILFVPLAGWLGWRLARVSPRHLLWDGQAWRLANSLSDTGMPVEPQVLIDLDDWLLLKAGPAYLPLAKRRIGADWGALRATLFSARHESV